MIGPVGDVDPGIESKVAFLTRPSSYGFSVGAVEVVETHRAWVFLTEAHAWKLKKPVKTPDLDFSTVEARLRDGLEEVRLNRRLAADVYLGVVPLTAAKSGELRLNGAGQVVDWIVQMKRLKGDQSLDALITTGRVTSQDVKRAARFLAQFYHKARAAPLASSEYQRRLAETTIDNRRELTRLAAPPISLQIQSLTQSQLKFLDEHRYLFDIRVQSGRIVEGHGDLRPDHIWLSDPPMIIDCLEFNQKLRTLDAVSELMFLVLECDRLNAGWIGDIFLHEYSLVCDDSPPRPLLEFYRGWHACTRAKLALWHLLDGRGDPKQWHATAACYLSLAAAPRFRESR